MARRRLSLLAPAASVGGGASIAMKTKTVLVVIGFVAAFATGAHRFRNDRDRPIPPADASPIDRLQGEWEVDRSEVGGNPVPLDPAKPVKWAVRGDRVTPNGHPESSFRIELDSGEPPTRIVFRPDGAFTSVGTYRIDGDRWTIRMEGDGSTGVRRTESQTLPGTKTVLLVLRRKRA